MQTGSSGTSVARDANDDNITSCRDRISFYVPFFPSPFSSSSPQRKFTSRLLVYFFARRNTRRTSLRGQKEREKTESLSIIFFHQLILNGTRSISSATVIPGIEFAPRRILVTSRPTLESYEILSFSPFFFSFRCTDFSHFDLFHRNGRSSGIREFTRAWCERSIDFILPMSDFDGKLFFGPRIILRPSFTTPTEIHSRSTFP